MPARVGRALDRAGLVDRDQPGQPLERGMMRDRISSTVGGSVSNEIVVFSTMGA
jgi:hypothetical protein